MATGYFLFLLISHFVLFVQPQTISTSTPVPPLQWINLSNILQGSAHPPPLRDAAIGYDETSRSLIIFGGLSENGIAQSQTFLLNLQTLTWSNPSPPPNLQQNPSSRSATIFGGDFAASNRHAFIVVGGKDANGKALSDVWEYDFNNQFWSEVELSPGGPSARWGASGGIDLRVPPTQDSTVPGPNNTFYLAGGFNGNTASPLSDVWKLKVSGTLSSNLPNSVQASWEHLSIGTKLPALVEQTGTVIMKQIISAGGCDSTSPPTSTNTTCARQDSSIVNTEALSNISPGPCPAPRVSPVLIPNLNAFSASFASQAFMLLGTFNSSLWNDTDGLSRGEVAILDINTGSWTRILPAGDPGSSGTAQFPTPREGASAFTFNEALVGSNRNIASDTIIFGGQDAKGNFLSDVWLLRAYTGVITPSNPTWTGFGNGNLQTGVNAAGSGVRVQYLTECASLFPTVTLPSSPNNGSNSGDGDSGQPSPVNPQTQDTQNTHVFDASFAHKLLAPLSIVALLPIILFFRGTQTRIEGPWARNQHLFLVSLAAIAGLAAYGLGVAGFVLAFITISSESKSNRQLHLKTGHGIAGLVFFTLLYVCLPVMYITLACFGKLDGFGGDTQSQKSSSVLGNSLDMSEKAETSPLPPRSDTPISLQNTSPPSSLRPRTLSWDASNVLRPSNEGGISSEPALTPRGFEVLNRPSKSKTSPGSPQLPGLNGASYRLPSTRSLGEIDWLLRRRSLNAVGELDYAITQAHNAQCALKNAVSGPSPNLDNFTIMAQPLRVIFLRTMLQASLLGLETVSLAQLWARSPRYLFAILLAILAAYYSIMFLLSWHHRPASSLLTLIVWRLRGKSPPQTSLADAPDAPAPLQGPYTHHRAPFRVSSHLDELSYSHHASPLSADTNDNDDDIDEDTRQRAIEEEMDRREVSIVTIPRRKLAVANPS